MNAGIVILLCPPCAICFECVQVQHFARRNRLLCVFSCFTVEMSDPENRDPSEEKVRRVFGLWEASVCI